MDGWMDGLARIRSVEERGEREKRGGGIRREEEGGRGRVNHGLVSYRTVSLLSCHQTRRDRS